MMTLNTEKARNNQEPSKRDMDAMSRLLLLGFYHRHVLVRHEYKFLGGINLTLKFHFQLLASLYPSTRETSMDMSKGLSLASIP